ncbi:MAG TPA: outer membrane beta-barrel protein [Polyangiaceae bacterium]|nr:outer membrane beta-barrel protein [Polyangiaceae bacterium]
MRRLAIPITLTLTFLASRAHSQEDTPTSPADAWPATAPARAVELNVGWGYTQGFGDISDSEGAIGDEAASGTAFSVGLGYRINPTWMLGGYGEGAFYRPDRGSLLDRTHYGASTGVQVQFHFSPFAKLDPWIGFGSGFRSYFVDSRSQGRKTLLGFDFARAQVGVAYRMSNGWSVTPVLGASLTEFFSVHGAGETGFQSISEPRPTSFLFAGMINRFDFGGAVMSDPSTLARIPQRRVTGAESF